ncbi:MAG: 1-deoxy-D-xylulose-5-phosphate reductoisomerase [Candidatus Omnitrophota bacterium]
MKNIAILGSTGSIGVNSLDVISKMKKRFNVRALSACSNIELLKKQIDAFHPKHVSVVNIQKAKEFKKRFNVKGFRFYEGEEGLLKMLEGMTLDIIIVGIVGSGALKPVLASLGSTKRLALANKEAIVMAGEIIKKRAKERNVEILPVDSEHNAIFQCLASAKQDEVKKIYLTGSGGPFLNLPKKDFKNITPKRAIDHPKWSMGKKISVDSASLMNKGLEVIEAHHLFNVPIKDIEVIVHPETVIHSMVEFCDGSIIAQLGNCDMRSPIQFALTYPDRFHSSLDRIDFSKLGKMHFFKPDLKKFPCLELAYYSARLGGTYPCVLNATNEVVVGEFLKGNVSFVTMPKIIEKVLKIHKSVKSPRLSDIIEADTWAKIKTKEMLGVINN